MLIHYEERTISSTSNVKQTGPPQAENENKPSLHITFKNQPKMDSLAKHKTGNCKTAQRKQGKAP